MPDFEISWVDMEHHDQTEIFTASNYEEAEKKLRKKHRQIFYMWKIDELLKKGRKTVFP